MLFLGDHVVIGIERRRRLRGRAGSVALVVDQSQPQRRRDQRNGENELNDLPCFHGDELDDVG